ncbi:LysR family transcriptional regulator [Paenibacillus validus]|uniref:LysR family transcriptional regulator n=1 Tax=Paenibacillus validus TaxID=44253 RepID=A0A7X2ZA08_9BACL|nr:LysR family transcriptional regulator [Paenibacillus validus]MUG70388.1 LysR family transcriptional regulator [Paenibacillus validus]
MTITQYMVFAKAMETGSFTKAAQALNMTQPAVSHAISGLESDLGVSLIVRDRRKGIVLTDVGQRVLVQIREILQRIENIEQIAAAEKGLEVGTIRIGTFPSAAAHFFPKIIDFFQRNYPNLRLELHEGTIEEVKEWLRTRVVDAGIIILPDGKMDHIPILRDKMVAVLRDDHPLCLRASVTINDLDSEPLIVCHGGYDAPIIEMFHQAGVRLNIAYGVYNVNTVLNMIKEGLGAAILSGLSLTHLPPGIQTRDLEPRVYRDVSIAVPSLPECSLAVQLFIKTMKQLFAPDSNMFR